MRALVVFATMFGNTVREGPVAHGLGAKGIAKRLEHRGYRLVAGPESFFVTPDSELTGGQLEHAERWGAELAESLRA